MDSGNFITWDALVPTTQSLIEKGVVLTIGETMGVSGEGQQTRHKVSEIVPTVDTVRYSFLSSLLLVSKTPILLTGIVICFTQTNILLEKKNITFKV